MASPNEGATPPSTANGAGEQSRRRKTGPSSRGVANLTPEQLARKRANDREAQRAIRERTKNHIETLNARIRELEGQRPYHDLQVVLQAKETVQAENTAIKQRLENVLTIIQPILRVSGGLNELAAAAERSPVSLLPPPQQRDAPVQTADPRQFHASLGDMTAPANGTYSGPSSPSSEQRAQPWLYPDDGPTSHMHRYSNSPPYEQPRAPEMPFDERLGVNFLLDNSQRRAVDPNLPPPAPPHSINVSCNSHAQYAPNLVAHLTLPRNTNPTCPLDVLLIDFFIDTQARVAEGIPVRSLVGPPYPNFTSLVYPERNVESHPLSQLFTDILRTFPDICGKPEQVAIVFIMFLIMRWLIEPSQENYDRLPHWMTPRPSQLFVGHPCWFDHLPWPKLRDKLIATKPFVSFENFFIPFTTTVSLNWPYEARHVLLPASKISGSGTSSIHASSPYSTHVHAGSPGAPPTPQAGTPGTPSAIGIGLAGYLPREDDQWLINPAFESHLRDLNNWTLGPQFRDTFPAFADCVKIKEGR